MGACLDGCHALREKLESFERSGHDDSCHIGYSTINRRSVDSMHHVFNVQGLVVRV